MTDSLPDVSRFVEAIDVHGASFDVVDAGAPSALDVHVSEVRRRRGRLADDLETGFRDVVLVEQDGVLIWQTADDVRGRMGRTRGLRRGSRRGTVQGKVLREVTVPILEPNEYLASLARTDEQLNAECHAGLRRVVLNETGKGPLFELSKTGTLEPLDGSTLILVHGTFSRSRNMLEEFAATPQGIAFLREAIEQRSGQVFAFDHPTLSVSPYINALDLSRALAGIRGKLDFVAHSRGGVVVRWCLDVLGDSLAGSQQRVVLAGSPMRGTSLASPNRLQPVLSVLSNIGAFLGSSMKIAAAANPFSLASLALLKFIVRKEKNRWGIPPVRDLSDKSSVGAAVAVIPGLQGQSASSNNYELQRLRESGQRKNIRYFALTADFEPEKIGWKLWKVLSDVAQRAGDIAADRIFPAENDLVVDTAHMTSLADGRDVEEVYSFGSQNLVHHCNYFRQTAALQQIRVWLSK